jgi:hypothetical protein
MAVQHGVVKGSNKEGSGGDMRNNGFLPLGGGASTVHPANRQGPGGDRRDGSFPLAGSASPVNPPNAKRWDVGMVGMPDQPFPAEPGKGAIPVNPFMPGGAAARALPEPDMAPRK